MDPRKLGPILIPAFMLPVIGVLVTGAIIGSAVPDSRGSLVFIAVPIIAVCMFAGVAGVFAYALVSTFKKRGLITDGKPVDLAAMSEALHSLAPDDDDFEQPVEVKRLLAEIEDAKRQARVVRTPERRDATRRLSGIAAGVTVVMMLGGIALGRTWYEVFGLGLLALVVILIWCAAEGGLSRADG